jgi:hypothetical protein
MTFNLRFDTAAGRLPSDHFPVVADLAPRQAPT